MTKMVRIENADPGNKPLVAETWKPGANGEPDQQIGVWPLESPTAMATLYIYDDVYIVIKELKAIKGTSNELP